MQRTFAIIKPDAVRAGAMGAILARTEAAGFRVVAARLIHMSKAEAEDMKKKLEEVGATVEIK